MRIVNVPSGMQSCADYNKLQGLEKVPLRGEMKDFCEERGFEDLLGYVDVEIQDSSKQSYGLVVCKLQTAKDEQVKEF